MRENFDIIGSYNNQRSLAISPERTVNMFEYIDANAKRPKVLINTSGLEDQELTFTGTISTSAARCQFVFGSTMLMLFGNKLFSIVASGTTLVVSVAGTFSTSSGFVGVDANTSQVIFVDGTYGYIYDATNGLRIITNTSFPTSPVDVCALDGFFVVAAGGTNTFQLSQLEQGLIWGSQGATATMPGGAATTINLTVPSSNAGFVTGTPVNFTGGGLPAEVVAGTTYYVASTSGAAVITVSATQGGAPIAFAGGGGTGAIIAGTVGNPGEIQVGPITSHPGTIVGCRTLHRRLFLFSQYFTEVWENAGIGSNLPFRRNNSLLMEYGTPAVGSIDAGFDRMFFLSQDRDGLGAVMEVTGTQAIPVSNRALDYQLSQYAAAGHVADAIGFLVKESGLIFYRLNFTLADHTFVLNVSMSDPENVRWHEEETLNGNRHPAQTHAYFNGMNYVGSYNEPILYLLDPNVYLNGDEKIKRLRIGKPLAPEGYKRLRIDRFQLDLLQGSVLNLIDTHVIYDITTELGVGIATETGDLLEMEQELDLRLDQDMNVFLSLTKDSGQTFFTTLVSPMGVVGDRTFVTVWRKLGTVPRGQAFVPKIEFYNNAPFVVIGAAWDYEVLPE